MVCNFHRLLCFAPRKKHHYFAPNCKALYRLKNIITAVLRAQQSWFLFVILSYYAASLQNYLDRNNYTQCSQIQSTTDCSKLESLILNIYIILFSFSLSLSHLVFSLQTFDSLNRLSLKTFFFLYRILIRCKFWASQKISPSLAVCLLWGYVAMVILSPPSWTITWHSKSSWETHKGL